MLIKISVKIKKITTTVGDATENIKQFTENVRRVASPAIITQIMVKWVRNLIKQRRKNNE